MRPASCWPRAAAAQPPTPTTAASPSAAGASTAPAASPSPAAELSGTITFLHKYSDPRYAPYFELVVAAYMAAHPKVTIQIQAESDQGVKDKLRVLAASKSLPDIYFSWASDFTKKFVRGGLAKDLTGDVTGAWKDSFTPAALDAYTYDGKLYGVPITLDAKYMAYNKKLFADNGVAVPTTLVTDLGWLSPVQGSASADNTFSQNVTVVQDIAKAKSMAIWLDTVTQIDVANAYLNGLQAMLDGTKTPAQVLTDIQAAAAKAKTGQ